MWVLAAHVQLKFNVMKMKHWTTTVILVVATVLASAPPGQAQLRWPDPPKKERTRARLVALVWADPRSSFFTSHEIFVAEAEVGEGEWSFIKLEFSFLPYQPRLLHSGFDYSVVHEFWAWRVKECDQTIADLTVRDWPKRRHHPLLYARDVPRVDLDQRRVPLPCYETNADEYINSTVEPIPPTAEPPEPELKERAKQ